MRSQQRVRVLMEDHQMPAGWQSVWDGSDVTGSRGVHGPLPQRHMKVGKVVLVNVRLKALKRR